MSFQKYLTEHVLLNEWAPVLSAAARAAASPAVRSIVADAASKKFKQTMASKYAPTHSNAGTRPPTTMHNYVGPSQGQGKKQGQASNSNNSRHHLRTVTNITNSRYNDAAIPNNHEPEQKAAKEVEEKKKKEESGLVNKTISSIPSATGKFAKWLSDSVQMQLSTP